MRVALLASHTTDFLAELLPLAGLSTGMTVKLVPVPHGHIETWLLGPARNGEVSVDFTVPMGSHDDLQLDAAARPLELVDAAVAR